MAREGAGRGLHVRPPLDMTISLCSALLRSQPAQGLVQNTAARKCPLRYHRARNVLDERQLKSYICYLGEDQECIQCLELEVVIRKRKKIPRVLLPKGRK